MYINLPRWAKDQKETKAKALKARIKRGNITIDPWEGGKEGFWELKVSRNGHLLVSVASLHYALCFSVMCGRAKLKGKDWPNTKIP